MTAPVFTLVDVGARGGIDPRWRAFADALRVVAIDADTEADEGDAGGAGRYEVIRAAVGPTAGSTSFYVTRDAGCSSTLRPNHALLARFPEAERFDVMDVTTVTPRPLDEILREHCVADVDFIKLDTQGSELSILESSPRALASTLGIEVEVEFVPLYDSQPLFGEVDRFLGARGFELFDLNRVYWRRPARAAVGRGQLVFADALYFRSIDSVIDAPAGGGLRVAKAVLAAAAYGYVDYARTLLARGRERHVFGEGEADIAAAWLDRAAQRSRRLLQFTGTLRGAGRVSRALARLAEVLQPDHWAYVDGRLGNSRK